MNHIVGAGTFRLIESPYISSTLPETLWPNAPKVLLLGSINVKVPTPTILSFTYRPIEFLPLSLVITLTLVLIILLFLSNLILISFPSFSWFIILITSSIVFTFTSFISVIKSSFSISLFSKGFILPFNVLTSNFPVTYTPVSTSIPIESPPGIT